MQTYTTQMDAARKGIVTPQMETVAKKEYRTVEEIRQLVAEGKVAIPANKHQNQRQPRRLPRLQGLQHRDAEGHERGQHGRRGHHGPLEPR